MEPSLISVIIPVYKVEKYLEKCVRSVMGQRIKELEIILVDDGSPDSCGDLCDRLAEEDSRIRVIHQANRGLSGARNAGLDAANGEYLCFLDSDDYWGSEYLEVMLAELRENGADLAVCPLRYEEEDGTVWENSPKVEPGLYGPDRMLEFLCTPASPQYATAHNRLYRSELWSRLRFPEGKLHEDEFTAHKIYASSLLTAVTDRTVYHYLQRSGSIMTSESPARQMDRIEAFLDRCRFLKERGRDDLFKASFRSFLHYYLTLLGSRGSVPKELRSRFEEIRTAAAGLLGEGAEVSRREKLAIRQPDVWRILHTVHGGKERNA